MEIKNQVCSLELAKKLKELGFEQNAFWSWDNHSDFGEGYILSELPEMEGYYSAYTVAELGEMLKKLQFVHYKNDENLTNRAWYKTDIFYEANYWQALIKFSHKSSEHYISDNEKTEANAKAKMLIYLKENKLIQKYSVLDYDESSI